MRCHAAFRCQRTPRPSLCEIAKAVHRFRALTGGRAALQPLFSAAGQPEAAPGGGGGRKKFIAQMARGKKEKKKKEKNKKEKNKKKEDKKKEDKKKDAKKKKKEKKAKAKREDVIPGVAAVEEEVEEDLSEWEDPLPVVLEKLVAVEEATVRKEKDVHSSSVGDKLPVGTVVAVLEQAECDGHVRVRIGENRWVSRETARGFVLLSPTEELLVAVEETTVRKKRDVHSLLVGDKLPVGTLVAVLEQAQCDGHVRVRIGENRWVSRETARGRVLLGPVGDEEADLILVELGEMPHKESNSVKWCSRLLCGAGVILGLPVGFIAADAAYNVVRVKAVPWIIWVTVWVSCCCIGWKLPKKLARRDPWSTVSAGQRTKGTKGTKGTKDKKGKQRKLELVIRDDPGQLSFLRVIKWLGEALVGVLFFIYLLTTNAVSAWNRSDDSTKLRWVLVWGGLLLLIGTFIFAAMRCHALCKRDPRCAASCGGKYAPVMSAVGEASERRWRKSLKDHNWLFADHETVRSSRKALSSRVYQNWERTKRAKFTTYKMAARGQEAELAGLNVGCEVVVKRSAEVKMVLETLDVTEKDHNDSRRAVLARAGQVGHVLRTDVSAQDHPQFQSSARPMTNACPRRTTQEASSSDFLRAMMAPWARCRDPTYLCSSRSCCSGF